MVSIDFTALFFGLSFLVFLGLMQLVFWGPIGRKLSQRETSISQTKQKTQALIAELEHKISLLREDPEIVSAQKQASELISRAKFEANETRTKLISEINSELEQQRNSSLSQLEADRNQVLLNLDPAIKEISELIVSSIVSQEKVAA